MTSLKLLKDFAEDELAPAKGDGVPARGDMVSFELADGGLVAIGHVSALAAGGAVKVRIDGVGSFLVPPGYVTLIERAH